MAVGDSEPLKKSTGQAGASRLTESETAQFNRQKK
jgi:hypothetical protein